MLGTYRKYKYNKIGKSVGSWEICEIYALSYALSVAQLSAPVLLWSGILKWSRHFTVGVGGDRQFRGHECTEVGIKLYSKSINQEDSFNHKWLLKNKSCKNVEYSFASKFHWVLKKLGFKGKFDYNFKTAVFTFKQFMKKTQPITWFLFEFCSLFFPV